MKTNHDCIVCEDTTDGCIDCEDTTDGIVVKERKQITTTVKPSTAYLKML